jgi:hypothetical protein
MLLSRAIEAILVDVGDKMELAGPGDTDNDKDGRQVPLFCIIVSAGRPSLFAAE